MSPIANIKDLPKNLKVVIIFLLLETLQEHGSALRVCTLLLTVSSYPSRIRQFLCC